jgi:Ni,Fe-hydrogenase III small subunit
MATNRPPRGATVWALPLDSSGCGACTQQIYALLGSAYTAELRAQGVHFARNPRHADVVLITGALSEAAREPIRRVLAGVPQPRALVAVGNCAIDGCVFRGSPHLVSNVAEVLDVNVEIAGCPPAPTSILAAIGEAAQLLCTDSSREEPETSDTADQSATVLDDDINEAAPDSLPAPEETTPHGRGGAR